MSSANRPLAICMLGAILAPACAVAAPCSVPNPIANGQVADASKVMDNFNAVAACADVATTTTGTPPTGSIAVFSGPKTVTNGNLTGDVTTAGGTTTTLATTGVVPGTYANASVVVDAKGRIMSATQGSVSGAAAWWFQPPAAADFNVNMMDNLTMNMVDDPDVGLLMSITPTTAASSGDSGQYMGKAIASPAGDWDVTTRLEFATRPPGNYTRWGLALSNGAKNKRVVFSWDNRSIVYWGYMSNPGGYGGTEQQTPWAGGGYPRWWRITHNAANATVNFYAGQDGKGWTLIRSMPDTSWLGETPKYIGVGFDIPDVTPGFDMPISIAYWHQSW